MEELNYSSFAARLRSLPGFDRVYDEHIAWNDELLPHVLLGDLCRFLSDEVAARGPDSEALKETVSLMENAMGSPDPLLQELVAVSFVENMDPNDPSFTTIRALFGPHLEQQYLRLREDCP